MTILLTGFEPFGDVEVNPSQLLAEHFATADDTVTAIVPVRFADAAEHIEDIITTHQPEAVLLLGVAEKREAIHLERIAVNINDARIEDNEGIQRRGDTIVSGAPVGYWSTLPLDAMRDAIAACDIPVEYSNHAGAYLCNHVFYRTRHYLCTMSKPDLPCGFIHVPPLDALPLDAQITAITACLEVLRSHDTPRLNVDDVVD